jgi:hypothetical protein
MDLGAWWPNPGYRWGLYGYLYPAYTNHPSELAFVILVIGALLLWQVSSRQPAVAGTPVRSIAALSTRTLVVACLVVLLLLLVLHSRPVPQNRMTPSFESFGRGSFGGYGKF